MRPPVKFIWKGNHHSYHGLWLIAFGAFQWYMGIDNGALSNVIPLWQTCIGIGTFMLIDDVVEHTITADTPLRLIYEKLILPFIK